MDTTIAASGLLVSAERSERSAADRPLLVTGMHRSGTSWLGANARCKRRFHRYR